MVKSSAPRPSDAVLVVEPVVEQLAVERLGSILEVEPVLVAALEVHVEAGGGDEVAVALGERSRMVGVEVLLVDGVRP